MSPNKHSQETHRAILGYNCKDKQNNKNIPKFPENIFFIEMRPSVSFVSRFFTLKKGDMIQNRFP